MESLQSFIVDESQATILNPLGISPFYFIAAIILKSIGVTLLDPVVLGICKLLGVKKLSSREPIPIMRGLEFLETKDYLFLLTNQVIETIGVMYFIQFTLFQGTVILDLEKVTIGNSVAFVYFAVILDDFIYYFAHQLMHHRSLYALCHKHHHRQSMPVRGYFDAANEHPLEQLIGLSIVLSTFHILALFSPFGVHAVGVTIFFVLYAVTAFLNHTEYDVQFGIMGLGYRVQAHEMHHRFPNCNYAQNIMIWDKLFGTFVEYRASNEKSK